MMSKSEDLPHLNGYAVTVTTPQRMDEYGLLLDATFCADSKLVPSCKNLLCNHKNKNQSQSTAECVR